MSCPTSVSPNIHSGCECFSHGLLPSSQLALSLRSTPCGCHPHPASSLGLPAPSENTSNVTAQADTQDERFRYLRKTRGFYEESQLHGKDLVGGEEGGLDWHSGFCPSSAINPLYDLEQTPVHLVLLYMKQGIEPEPWVSNFPVWSHLCASPWAGGKATQCSSFCFLYWGSRGLHLKTNKQTKQPCKTLKQPS